MNLKDIIRSTLHKLGLEVHRYVPPEPSREAKLLASSLQKFEIDLVLDVCANIGQFASEIRRCGYAGKIVSFEPLSQAHAELLQSSDGDPMWDVFPRCALGDHNGEVEINIAGNSELYSAADATVAPSMQENLSNSVMESLSCGTPVIAFNIGGMPDMIDHQSNGYLAKAFESDDLAAGIMWVLENQPRLKMLSDQARQTVVERYSLENVAKRYMSLYQDILGA